MVLCERVVIGTVVYSSEIWSLLSEKFSNCREVQVECSKRSGVN